MPTDVPSTKESFYEPPNFSYTSTLFTKSNSRPVNLQKFKCTPWNVAKADPLKNFADASEGRKRAYIILDGWLLLL